MQGYRGEFRACGGDASCRWRWNWRSDIMDFWSSIFLAMIDQHETSMEVVQNFDFNFYLDVVTPPCGLNPTQSPITVPISPSEPSVIEIPQDFPTPTPHLSSSITNTGTTSANPPKWRHPHSSAPAAAGPFSAPASHSHDTPSPEPRPAPPRPPTRRPLPTATPPPPP